MSDAQRIDRLFEDWLEPWRQAWGQFWDEAWLHLSDHELDLILDSSDEAPLDRAQARLLEISRLSAFGQGES